MPAKKKAAESEEIRDLRAEIEGLREQLAAKDFPAAPDDEFNDYVPAPELTPEELEALRKQRFADMLAEAGRRDKKFVKAKLTASREGLGEKGETIKLPVSIAEKYQNSGVVKIIGNVEG